MNLTLCGVVSWDDIELTNQDTHLKYCNAVWHDGELIHLCADYDNHAHYHECECGENGES